MLTRKHLWIAVALMIVVSLLLWGDQPPAASAPGTGQYGGELVIGYEGDVLQLNGLLFSSGMHFVTYNQIYDALFWNDPSMTPQPLLAEGYSIEDNGRTYIVRLKRNVKWHDGRPLTARDVVFTIYAHLNPKVNSGQRSTLSMLAGFEELTDPRNPADPNKLAVKPVERVDDYTVRFRLKTPYAPFLTVLALPRMVIVPEHIMAKEADLNASVMNTRPIGSGPFKFKEWVKGERLVLEAFADYHGGKPFLDRLIFRPIPETAVRMAELESGGVQFVAYPPPDSWKRLIDNPRIGTLHGNDEISFRAFTVGHVFKPNFMSDVRVRKAFAHAISLNEIVRNLNKGYGLVATGPIGRSHWAYSPDVATYNYDPSRAKRLLAEAGFKPGRDGMLEKDGVPLKIDLVTSLATENYQEICELVQERLRQIGVMVEIPVLERGVYNERFLGGQFHLFLGSWTGSADPDANFYRRFHSKGSRNVGTYRNKRVDELLEAAQSVTDRGRRKQYYAEFQKIVTEEVADVFAWHPVRFYAFDARLKGLKFTPLGEAVTDDFRRAYWQR